MSEICPNRVAFLFSAYLVAIFVTIATVKDESLGLLFLKTNEKKLVKMKSHFGLIGGQNSLLMHAAFYESLTISSQPYLFVLVRHTQEFRSVLDYHNNTYVQNMIIIG